MIEWPTRDLVAHRAATTPDRTALIDAGDGREWTYRDLDRLVGEFAAGLGPGGPVGVLMNTRPEFAALAHAAMRQGRTLVVLNAQLPTATLAEQARRAGVGTVVCGSDTEESAREIAGGDAGVASVDPPSADAVDALRPGTGGEVEPAALAPGDTAVVLFTSGTTGEPKGVRLTVGNLVAGAVGSAFRLGVAPGDRWLCCLPMYHMGGLAPALRCPLYGTSLAVQSGFDADRTAAAVADRGVTGVSLVPTQVRRLLAAGWEPPGQLQTVLVGGAPCPPGLVREALDRGVPIHPTYGTTETASQVATARPAEVREQPDTVGAPLVVTEVTVLRDGEPAPAGEVGELAVAGPTVTPGYLDADRTAAATSEFGLLTGDLGYRDGSGRLFVTGRVDDAITTGGETVHPSTVADALREHPAVTDAAVVGLPDPEWGERVGALVVADGADAADLREWCRGRVADYAVPKTVGFAADLPRTASGTVDRDAVRERLGG